MKTNTEFFALTPWTTMYVKPTGEVYPCQSLAWQTEYCAGNILTDNLIDIWNSEAYKKLRLSVLNNNTCDINDPLSLGCSYLQVRDRYNTDIEYYRSNTKSDGSFEFNLKNLHLKRTNICNLTCLYCKPQSSSSWASLLNVPNTNNFTELIFWEKFKQCLSELIECNISGGEPLLDPFYERLLEHLLKVNPTIQINVTTNLTYNMEKKKTFFQTLEKFTTIPKIACSVDSNGQNFELIRRNSEWDLVHKNLHILKTYNVFMFFCVPISILNCFTLKEYHEFLIKEKLADIDTIRYQPVCSPEFLSIRNLSKIKKLTLKHKMLSYVKFLKDREIEKVARGETLNLWCNGNKSVSDCILNFIFIYLNSKPGREDYIEVLSEHISSEQLQICNIS